MPFFDNDEYMSSPDRIWIWVVLTIPSTAFAFLLYFRITGRHKRQADSQRSQASTQASTQDVPLQSLA
jgi:hypothetical protein